MKNQSDILLQDRYCDGSYLASTGGTWHLEDSAFKAGRVLKALRKHRLDVASVCEIGCGAGGILACLQEQMPGDVRYTGYDISPQAHALSESFANERLRFVLGDAFEFDERFDLVLVMDVVEHVEDCFGFLRRSRDKGCWKLYHIPLEIHCSAALRDSYLPSWRQVGHIHVFSLNRALEALRFTGHEVIDYCYTPSTLACGKRLRSRCANALRRITPAGLAARLFGGYSVLILAK